MLGGVRALAPPDIFRVFNFADNTFGNTGIVRPRRYSLGILTLDERVASETRRVSAFRSFIHSRIRELFV